MEELVKPLITGAIVGLLFAAFKLPIPAPSAIEGIMGVIGIFAGYLLWNKLF